MNSNGAASTRQMIESGSHTPGVDVAAFGLPANTAVRYEQPDPRLAPFLTDYHVLDSIEPENVAKTEWMLPSWAAIRFLFTERPLAVTIGNRSYDPMPVASLYGTTSRAMRVSTHGGVTIGAGVSPLGWARLFREPARSFCDRIVPLDTLLPAGRVAVLTATLSASDRGPAVKAILDAFFLDQIGAPDPDEAIVRHLLAQIAAEVTPDPSEVAAAIGITPGELRRVSSGCFGFPPKTLLMRTRFLRSLLRIWDTENGADYSLIAKSYHDASHFLRDSNRFLGMTPKRFIALDTPYLRTALRARAEVLGAAMGPVATIEPSPNPPRETIS